VTHVARPLRGLPPVVAALAAVIATALPAAATDLAASAPPASRPPQWWLADLHVPAALRAAPAAGKGVTVAVLSTGVDLSHPDLSGSVTAGPDFAVTGRKQGSPYWGQEGTAVAGLIAGHGHGHGRAVGITGVAPAARILSVQVTLEYNDPLTTDATVTRRLPAAIAAGIRYAVSHGASIIALPLDPGTLGPAAAGHSAAAGGSTAERAAVRYALAHNVLLVAPAGDNGAGGDSVSYPAAYPGVVAVGATARDGRLAPFTNTRSYVALTAPGSGQPPATSGTAGSPAAGLTVAAPGGGYQSLASTDMSAALAAGVAALIRSRYPRLDAAAVTRALESGVTAPRAGGTAGGPGWGHGQLNAAAAVAAAAAIFAKLPAPAPSPSATPSAAPTRTAPVATISAVPRPADPGRLLRSLVVGLAVGAGALIACLIGAIIVTRVRRRRRFIRSTSPAAAARAGQARHARVPPGLPAGVSPGSGAVSRYPVVWSGMEADGRHYRRQRGTETPPWPPAPPPDGDVPLPVPLPAPQVRPALPSARAALPAAGPLPPWEESPAEFAVAPPEDRALPRTGANTGPMYVWNPGETTGQFPAIGQDPDPWE
jgi:subtilisin family serine protease